MIRKMMNNNDCNGSFDDVTIENYDYKSIIKLN